MSKNYGHDFYADRHRNTVYSARTILALVLDVLPPVHSAIDFGCGVGTWLSVLKGMGVSRIKGLDGPWVERNLLEIPAEDFETANFEASIVQKERYDLAITLEVAEHVSHESADRFINSLVENSDFVLFSAAIPYQGGVGHDNEQWPEYWRKKFAEREYVALDFIRKKIWDNERIPFWYRQNIILLVKKEKLSSLNLDAIGTSEYGLPNALVHPDLYLSKISRMSSVAGTFKLFRRALKNRMSGMLNKKAS
jgi:cyclopropane fatty-acyl-phospholipid synthase-like methyltransferase